MNKSMAVASILFHKKFIFEMFVFVCPVRVPSTEVELHIVAAITATMSNGKTQ